MSTSDPSANEQSSDLTGRLSRCVKSIRERELSMASANMSWRQRAMLFLYRHHRPPEAIGAALAVTLLPLVAAALIGGVASASLTEEQYRAVDEAISETMTMAQIMGGVYAILLAVVVFSVQLHAQREDENAFMVRYLIRRHGVYWIAAAAVGITLANAFLPVLRSLGLPMDLSVILWFDIVTVPLTLLWSLRLLVVTIRDATAPTFDSTFPAFKQDMTFAVAADQYAAAMAGAFDAKLGATLLTHNRLVGLSTRASPEWRMDFAVEKGRHVADIDLDALRELSDTLKALPDTCKLELTLGPGETSDGGPCLVLSSDEAAPKGVSTKIPAESPELLLQADVTEKTPPHPVQVLTPALRDRIKAKLNALYVAGDPPPAVSDELNEFLKRYRERLLILAKEGASVKLEVALEWLRELVQHWCQLATDTEPGTTPRWLRSSSQRFAGPLAVDLRDVVAICMGSGDQEKAATILDFLIRIVLDGINAKHFRLADEAAQLVAFAYYRGITSENPQLAEFVGERLDGYLHSALYHFSARHSCWPIGSEYEWQAKAAQEQPFLDRALALGIELTFAAMEEGREEDAKNFFDRLFEHKRHEHRHRFPPPPAPTKETAATVHDYILIAVYSWALHLLEENYRNSQNAASAVLNLAIKLLPPRHELIALWELYHGESRMDTLIDHRLGIAHRNLRHREQRRIGVIYTNSGGDDWLPNGFNAALLLAAQPYRMELERFYSAPPPQYLWNSAGLKPMLEKLVNSPVLKIPEAERLGRVSDTISLVEARERAAKVAYIQHVTTSPVDQDRRIELVTGVGDGILANRNYVKAICSIGGCQQIAVAPKPGVVKLRSPLPREVLMADGSDVTSMARWIGGEAAFRETVVICHAAEKAAQTGGPIRILAELPDNLRQAANQLREKSYTPNLVLLPRNLRFAAALFRKPFWEVEDTNRFGEGFYGVWEGMHVAQWPYTDPGAVVIADASKLFGKVHGAEALWHVDITEPEAAELAAVCEKAVSATTTADVPVAHSVQVWVDVRLTPAVGILDPNAAIALSTENSDGGYAMIRGEKVYHRPSCESLVYQDDVVFSLASRLPDEKEDRRPCEVCKPERWDAEAVRDSMSREARAS